MADKKSEVYITVNHQQAETAVKQLKKSLASLTQQHNQLVAAGKEGTKRAKNLWAQMKDLSAVIKENETNLKLVGNVMNNLAGSTLSQLNRALKNVKKEMNRVSGDSDRLELLQEQYRAINEQIRIMKGEMVNIKKHINDLSSVSDDWLSKAISQQKTLVGTLKQGTPEYIKQINALRTLGVEQANRAQQAVNSGSASAETLRSARNTLTSFRDNIGVGELFDYGSAEKNAKQIEQINALLKTLETQLGVINGKEQEIKLSTQDIIDQAEKIKLNPEQFSPKQIKAALSDIEKELQNITTKDPARERLGQSAKELQKILDGVDNELIDIKNLLEPRNLKTASIDKLKKAAAQLEKEIAGMNREMGDFTKRQEELQMIRGEIERATGSVKKHASAWQTTIRNISTYFGVFQLFAMIQDKLTAIIKLNLQFSDQLADIRKVSGLAMSDVNQLAVNLSKIDSRTSVEELNKIAYAGSKLGIGKYGIAGLEAFTRAANQVNVALKEDLGDDALTALSKITEVMGLIPKMGVEKSMLATGSAMFQLAATSTATANNIVEFSKRLTGMARTAGLTTDQLLALGSASDSMFLAPEVASTAFSKFITSLQKNHNLIEKELHIEPGTINELYSAGKTMDAIVLILEKMKAQGNMNALQDIFKPLGSDGARLVNVMVTMSKNVDMLKDHIYTASEAFEEATAVTNEYNIQQETANALMERATNIWEKSFVNPQGVDYVKSLAQQWYDLSQAFTSSNLYMSQLKGTLLLLWGAIKIGLALLPLLLQFLMFKGVYSAGNAVVNLFTKGLIPAAKNLASALMGAKVAQDGLNKSMKANVFGLIISLVATAIFYFADYGEVLDTAADAQKNLSDYTADAAAKFDEEKRKIDSYIAVLNDANTSVKERERLLKKFNHEYQPYLTKLGLEVKSVDDLRNAYEALNGEIKKKMYYQMREQAYNDKLGEASGKMGNAAMDYSKYIHREGSDFQAFDTKWLQSQVDAGKSSDEIYKVIMEATYGKGGVWSGYNGDYLINNKSKKDSGLRSRIATFVNANKNYSTTKKEIDDTFNPIIGDYDPFKEDEIGTLDREAEDKAEAARRKKEEAERKKAIRAEMKDEQQKARAIIDNVKNYYERQIMAITDLATKTNMDPELQAKMVDAMEIRMNKALANVRKAISGTENEWTEFRETLIKDLYEPLNEDGTNESTQLLDNIIHNDVDKLKEMIVTLSKELGQNGNVLLDQVWRKATENSLKVAKMENSKAQERQKIIMEQNYTGKVDKEYEGQMEQLGIAELNEEQTAQLMGLSQTGNGDAVQSFLDKRSELWKEAFTSAREHMIDLIVSDPTTEKGRDQILRLLYGEDYKTKLTGSPLATILDMEADQWEVFYDKLIQYGDDYTEALKKVADREKKLLDFRLKSTQAYRDAQTASASLDLRQRSLYQFTEAGYKQREDHQKAKAQKKQKLGSLDDGNSRAQTKREGREQEQPVQDPGSVERSGMMGGSKFFESFSYDPQLEGLKAEMALRQQAMDLAIAEGQMEENIAARKEELWKAQAAYYGEIATRLKAQMDEMYGLAAPVESFGSSMGKAFATMTEDAEAGRAAIRAAIGDMINSFMEQTVKMTEEFIKRRVMQTMYDQLMSQEIIASTDEQVGLEKEKQDKLNDAQEEGQSEKTSIFKKLGRSFTKLFKKQSKQEITAEEKKQDEILDVQESGGEAQEILNVDVKSDIQDATEQIGSQTLATQQAQTTQEVATESAKTQANTVMGIASGAAKIIGSLGWWGIPLVAVITALLNGLLAFAMGKVSSLFGGGSDSGSDSGPATKLVTGMLTYDAGNVQSFDAPDGTKNPNRPKNDATPTRSSDNEPRPVLGADGQVYNAREAGELQTGLVTEPITTLVNGQPAIVGEKGPEMVIGRETTEALQMARPDIIRDIIKFDKNFSGRGFRVFDSGNVGDLDLGDGNIAQGLTSEDIDRLNNTISNLGMVLTLLQKNGIPAHINKYGRGGVTNEAASGADFMKTFSGDPLWKRG